MKPERLEEIKKAWPKSRYLDLLNPQASTDYAPFLIQELVDEVERLQGEIEKRTDILIKIANEIAQVIDL